MDAAGDAGWILFIGSGDRGHVLRLAETHSASLNDSLSQAIAGGRPWVVAAESPPPADLQQQHSAAMLTFLHRLQSADLVLMPRLALTADCSLTLADAVLQHCPQLEILPRGAGLQSHSWPRGV
ncbi:MAG: hypothetical protein ACKO3T_04380 [Planctomycetaceae bacterium]